MSILQVERLRPKECAENRAVLLANYAENGIFLSCASVSEPGVSRFPVFCLIWVLR